MPARPLALGLRGPNRVAIGRVRRMVAALRRLGGNLWMVDTAFSGAFVDNVGTQPVTAYADLLGLTTDRLGLLGANLFTGTYALGAFTTATYSGGEATVTFGGTVPASGNNWLSIPGNTAAGTFSVIEYWATYVSGGNLEVGSTWQVGDTITAASNGGVRRRYTTRVRTGYASIGWGPASFGATSAGSVWKVEVISVRELTGSHATQSAVASKPTVQRINGRNVISFDGSNDFLQTGISTGNEGWVCAGVTLGTTGIGHHLFGNGGASATDVGVWLRVASTNNTATLLVSNGTTREITSAVTSTLTGAPKVIDGGWGAATMFAAVDGVETSIAKTVNCTTSKTCQIGGSNSVGWYTNGTMHAEVYTPVLPDAATRKIIRDGIAALQGRGPL